MSRGGLSEVWEGYDEVLARPVAVTVFHPRLAADAGFLDGFRSEAIAAARLGHSNIVATFDAGVEDGVGFLVMELVGGTNLGELLRQQGPLSCRQAVDIAVQVADALDYAHRKGILHHNVKPTSILCHGGQAKLSGFGVAKTSGQPEAAGQASLSRPVAYLAPEQLDGRQCDRRADIYSLGVVLYEMLCGRTPSRRPELRAPEPGREGRPIIRPRQLRADIPRPLEEVILRALAENPNDRYPSAADFRLALLAVDLADDDALPLVDHHPTPPGGIVPSFRQSERSWLVPAALIVVVGLALGFAGVLFRRTEVGQQLLDQVRKGVEGTQSPSAAASALRISSVTSFDPAPDGDGSEREADVDNVIDNRPSTTWRTERYNSPQFGNLKPGVGLVFGLDRLYHLARLQVTSPTAGWSAAVYVADHPGSSLADWGQPIDVKQDIEGDTGFELGARTGRAVLLWITRLGDDEPSYSAAISEVTLSGY